MEDKKIIKEQPKISIKKEPSGNYYLDFQIPERLKKHIEQEVLNVSGAVVIPV